MRVSDALRRRNLPPPIHTARGARDRPGAPPRSPAAHAHKTRPCESGRQQRERPHPRARARCAGASARAPRPPQRKDAHAHGPRPPRRTQHQRRASSRTAHLPTRQSNLFLCTGRARLTPPAAPRCTTQPLRCSRAIHTRMRCSARKGSAVWQALQNAHVWRRVACTSTTDDTGEKACTRSARLASSPRAEACAEVGPKVLWSARGRWGGGAVDL